MNKDRDHVNYTFNKRSPMGPKPLNLAASMRDPAASVTVGPLGVEVGNTLGRLNDTMFLDVAGGFRHRQCRRWVGQGCLNFA